VDVFRLSAAEIMLLVDTLQMSASITGASIFSYRVEERLAVSEKLMAALNSIGFNVSIAPKGGSREEAGGGAKHVGAPGADAAVQ